ncbi:class GN sortase [Desulfopila inferna]|uniref:class GN sortase n=1 Tax=Desulfopila inferna TaxID=468528 RepID=UPI0019664B1F|nr:class GN sortase [Desulfopila inferna]MBM9604062.1 class GN sortase [Desulfopila inferna]
MKMKRWIGRRTGLALILLAALFIGDGLYIKAKAIVAQHLLQQAWQQTISGKNPVKPWPWADTWPVARLRVERLGIDCIVLEGESGEVLAFGPGHLSQSAKPATEGNCALVGHRDTSFGFLNKLEKGDVLLLQNIDDAERRYQVVSTVIKNQQDLFVEETVTPWLTLITCYPFDALQGGSEQRFVVFAREIRSQRADIAVHLGNGG